MQIKEIWLDCECGGLVVGKNPLIQVAGDIVIDGRVRNTFDIKMNAGGLELEKEALEVIKKTPEEIALYQSPAEAFKQFKSLLKRYVNPYNKKDKFEWYGYNPRFDVDFVRDWFEKNNDKYFGSWFWMPVYDVWQMAVHAMREHRSDFENTKLWTMAKLYGVDVDQYVAHDAASDSAVCRALYYKVMEYRQHSDKPTVPDFP